MPKVVGQEAVTGAGSSDPIPANSGSPVYGFSAVVSGGTVSSYDVEIDMGDGTWHDHDSVAAASATANGNIVIPFESVRATINTGTGTVTLTLVQADQ